MDTDSNKSGSPKNENEELDLEQMKNFNKLLFDRVVEKVLEEKETRLNSF